MTILNVGQDIFCINFANIGVRDIGRRSLVGLVTGFTLSTEITSALFQIAEIKLSLRLDIAHIGIAIVFESSFKIQFGMESGPITLDILMLESCFSPSSRVMMNLSGSGTRSLDTDANVLFISSASFNIFPQTCC